MSEEKRKIFSSQFKPKIALEELREVKMVNMPGNLVCIQRKRGCGRKSYKNRLFSYLRHREGLAIAKENCKYKGRKPIEGTKLQQVRTLVPGWHKR